LRSALPKERSTVWSSSSLCRKILPADACVLHRPPPMQAGRRGIVDLLDLLDVASRENENTSWRGLSTE